MKYFSQNNYQITFSVWIYKERRQHVRSQMFEGKRNFKRFQQILGRRNTKIAFEPIEKWRQLIDSLLIINR